MNDKTRPASLPRRDFIKQSAALGSAAALGGLWAGSAAAAKSGDESDVAFGGLDDGARGGDGHEDDDDHGLDEVSGVDVAEGGVPTVRFHENDTEDERDEP